MANKLMKSWSTSLTTGEMQIKATLRYCFTGFRTTVTKKTSASEDAEETEPSCTVARNVNRCRQQFGNSPKILKIAISLLGIHSKKMKTLIENDICASIVIAALFTIAKL